MRDEEGGGRKERESIVAGKIIKASKCVLQEKSFFSFPRLLLVCILSSCFPSIERKVPKPLLLRNLLPDFNVFRTDSRKLLLPPLESVSRFVLLSCLQVKRKEDKKEEAMKKVRESD